MEPFADRLDDAVRSKRSPLCVGIDPRLDKIPVEIREAAGGDPGKTLLRFGLEVIDLVAEHAACVKPNIAFFEAYGLAGLSAYAGIVRGARARGLLTIGDAKRGDMGATAEAYAAAHLTPGSDFEVDALTVNPYLGGESLEPFMKAAASAGKGLFVLVRTSNPGAVDLQDVTTDDGLVYERVARLVDRWGRPHRGRSGFSLVGAVVGATWPEQARKLRAALPSTPFLVPGYGAQGATSAAGFLPDGRGAVVNASRSVIFPSVAGAGVPSVGSWRDAVVAAARGAKEELDAAVRR